MGRVLEICKGKLLSQRKSDNDSLRKLIIAVAREIKVNVTETQVERAVMYLKYGKAVW